MFRIAQRRRLGIDVVWAITDVSIAQNAETFGIGGHETVFDSIMDHLHEVARAVLTAVKITMFGRSAEPFAAGRLRDIADTRRQCPEDGIETFDDVVLAADHHAVAALKSPNAAAGANV